MFYASTTTCQSLPGRQIGQVQNWTVAFDADNPSTCVGVSTMRIRVKLFAPAVAMAALAFNPAWLWGWQSPSTASNSEGQQSWRGMGGFPGGGRGILGAVTAVAPDHYTIKTDTGDSYIVHFSVNTHIMKELAGRGPSAQGRGGGDAAGGSGEGERVVPQSLKSSDIKVGDVITAGGEVDAAGKSIGAV